ncbi:hypothetical protein G6F60_015767 [Rhizopus arrhizus]|nr:hypothetical protein G6F60_015767 [Rhizopus arrhizus]
MDATRLREVGVAQIIKGLQKQMDVGGEEIKRMRERIDIGKVDKTLNDNVANSNRMKGLIEGAGRDWAW